MTWHTLTRLFSKTALPGSWVRDGGTKPTMGSDGPRASVMLGAYGSCVAGALLAWGGAGAWCGAWGGSPSGFAP